MSAQTEEQILADLILHREFVRRIAEYFEAVRCHCGKKPSAFGKPCEDEMHGDFQEILRDTRLLLDDTLQAPG